MALRVERLVVGELEENCFLAWNDAGSDAVVFDPGDEAERIAATAKELGVTISAMLLTHCHGDHIGGMTDLRSLYPRSEIYVPLAEAEWLQRPTLNLSYFLGVSVTAPEADRTVSDGDVIRAGGLAFRAIHVPGHSPGGTAYFVEAEASGKPHLFCGDILFAGSIGRADLPGGAGEAILISNIRQKLFVLPGNTIIHPGHGPDTTVNSELKYNPYCGKG